MHYKADNAVRTCTCGADFKTWNKLWKHVQKWNTKWFLRDAALPPLSKRVK